MTDTLLDGRVALVTGGGRGAGAAIATALAEAGAAVIVVARTASQVRDVAARLTVTGGRAWSFVCDVSDPAAVEGLVSVVTDAVGSVDILVNNAGLAVSAAVTKTSVEDWQRVMAVNATAPFLCTRAWLPNMVARRWGRIVNIASTAGLSGDRYIAAYAASKHALVGLTRAVAAEVAEHGVTVNAVCPSYLDTDMTVAALDRISATTGRDRAAALDILVARSPQKRLVKPAEVAALVTFLCGEPARGITGACLTIDGGELRR